MVGTRVGHGWRCVRRGSLQQRAVYGGEFTTVGGLSVNRIVKWNGTNWSALESGVRGSYAYVYALTVYDNALYVGGGVSTAGGRWSET